MSTGEFNAGDSPVMDQHPTQGGVEILLVASCYRNWDKLRPEGHLARMRTLHFYLGTRQWVIFGSLCQEIMDVS